MKNVAVLMKDGAFALFFFPHPEEITHIDHSWSLTLILIIKASGPKRHPAV